jgi:hypothetical protein
VMMKCGAANESCSGALFCGFFFFQKITPHACAGCVVQVGVSSVYHLDVLNECRPVA